MGNVIRVNGKYVQIGDKITTWNNLGEYDRIEAARKVASDRLAKYKEIHGTISPRLMFKLLNFCGNGAKKFSLPSPSWKRIDGCINYWNVGKGSDSGTHVFVFTSNGGKKGLRKIRKAFIKAGFSLEGIDINSPYDCTGEYFSRSCTFHVCNGRVFVTQHWGLDV